MPQMMPMESTLL
uniref:ATP synthase F0 subunit 8 n=1 Tax=Aciculitermes sp. T3.10f TaxID=1934903 RepID=A0A1S5VV42_9NEOP|nr:ATP synthase F0 subunit 8 [Aciculitermes sp. T3.10f]